MPNHVTHKITFAAEHAERVFAAVCPEGHFSFEAIVPQPPQLYHGDVSAEDEKDFECNWYRWNVANWGTKWGAYASTCGLLDDGRAFIKFDTAWSVPYPILSAFNNRFQIPFEHRYYDECSNFWGIETWGPREYPKDGPIVRLTKRLSNPADQLALGAELKGYSPAEEDEAA